MKQKSITLAAGGCAMAVALLSSCTTPDPADTNKDGVLTVPELEVALVDALINYSDKDGDGMVTLAEWSEVNSTEDDAMFHKRDLNSDGKIDRDEAMKSTKKSETWDRLIAKIDTNGDGKIDESEKAAFRAEMAKGDKGNQVNKLQSIANENEQAQN